MSTKSIIESSFRKALYNFDLIEDGKIAIALSGGKDSLTLLYLLHAVSGRGFPKFDLHAFHVQGTFSCGPAITSNFLQKMCDDMGVPLSTAKERVRKAREKGFLTTPGKGLNGQGEVTEKAIKLIKKVGLLNE